LTFLIYKYIIAYAKAQKTTLIKNHEIEGIYEVVATLLQEGAKTPASYNSNLSDKRK